MSIHVPSFPLPYRHQQQEPPIYEFDNRIYALLAPFRNACLLRWNPVNRTPLNNRTINVDAKIYVLTRQSLVLAADDTALVWGGGADMI